MMPQNVYLNRYYERGESRPEEHITLLTDRALYRPGQTVYVKGIAYEQEADKAHVLAGKSYQVRLLDVNRKELVQKNVSTNEFGSFTTEFALPAVCLNGNFTIDVKNNASVPYGWRITNGLPLRLPLIRWRRLSAWEIRWM